MISKREEIVKDAVLNVAKLMVASAITAPKAKGIDNVVASIIIDKKELEKLAKKMEELADKYGSFFKRDAENIRKSHAVVLIGCKVVDIGVKKPEEYRYDVNLVLSLLNLGIAVGSAVKTASIHNIDNRIMFTAGVAAQHLKLLDADIVIAIPLSVYGKSIYFDRK